MKTKLTEKRRQLQLWITLNPKRKQRIRCKIIVCDVMRKQRVSDPYIGCIQVLSKLIRYSIYQNTFIMQRTCWIPLLSCNCKIMYNIRVITKLPNTEQSSKGKGKTHNKQTDKISQQPENWKNRNGPDLYRHFQRNGGLNQILRRQTSRFHYG